MAMLKSITTPKNILNSENYDTFAPIIENVKEELFSTQALSSGDLRYALSKCGTLQEKHKILDSYTESEYLRELFFCGDYFNFTADCNDRYGVTGRSIPKGYKVCNMFIDQFKRVCVEAVNEAEHSKYYYVEDGYLCEWFPKLRKRNFIYSVEEKKGGIYNSYFLNVYEIRGNEPVFVGRSGKISYGSHKGYECEVLTVIWENSSKSNILRKIYDTGSKVYLTTELNKYYKLLGI